jgi:hypothetical protein
MLKYLVGYGGGVGPNVWDEELTVDANDIHEALAKAAPHVWEAGAVIFSIEQYDETETCPIHIP